MTQKLPIRFKKIVPWIVLVMALLVAGFLFIGHDSIINLYASHVKAKKTEREIERTRAEIDSLSLETKRLRNDTAYIEKIAREKLGMAGKKEKIYKFIESK
jgi:cell division protein FtsB